MSNRQQVKPGKRASLGRGLGSLLGNPLDNDEPTAKDKPHVANQAQPKPQPQPQPKPATEPVKIPDTSRIWSVAIDKLMPNEGQPRKEFADKALMELALSIKEKGILQPIVARRNGPDRFQIIAGERRWRAAQRAGLHEVPVILKNVDLQNALELALIENIQRQDLNPVEEAEAYDHLLNEYGLTQQQLADKVGKERATIANVLRLLQLHKDVRAMVAAGELSLGQAKVLLSLSDPKMQKRVALKVKDEKLTVRGTEKLVQKQLRSQDNAQAKIADVDISGRLIDGLSAELQKILGTKVNIDYAKGKGKISINFYSDDELNQLVDKLRDAWLS